MMATDIGTKTRYFKLTSFLNHPILLGRKTEPKHSSTKNHSIEKPNIQHNCNPTNAQRKRSKTNYSEKKIPIIFNRSESFTSVRRGRNRIRFLSRKSGSEQKLDSPINQTLDFNRKRLQSNKDCKNTYNCNGPSNKVDAYTIQTPYKQKEKTDIDIKNRKISLDFTKSFPQDAFGKLKSTYDNRLRIKRNKTLSKDLSILKNKESNKYCDSGHASPIESILKSDISRTSSKSNKSDKSLKSSSSNLYNLSQNKLLKSTKLKPDKTFETLKRSKTAPYSLVKHLKSLKSNILSSESSSKHSSKEEEIEFETKDTSFNDSFFNDFGSNLDLNLELDFDDLKDRLSDRKKNMLFDNYRISNHSFRDCDTRCNITPKIKKKQHFSTDLDFKIQPKSEHKRSDSSVSRVVKRSVTIGNLKRDIKASSKSILISKQSFQKPKLKMGNISIKDYQYNDLSKSKNNISRVESRRISEDKNRTFGSDSSARVDYSIFEKGNSFDISLKKLGAGYIRNDSQSNNSGFGRRRSQDVFSSLTNDSGVDNLSETSRQSSNKSKQTNKSNQKSRDYSLDSKLTQKPLIKITKQKVEKSNTSLVRNKTLDSITLKDMDTTPRHQKTTSSYSTVSSTRPVYNSRSNSLYGYNNRNKTIGNVNPIIIDKSLSSYGSKNSTTLFSLKKQRMEQRLGKLTLNFGSKNRLNEVNVCKYNDGRRESNGTLKMNKKYTTNILPIFTADKKLENKQNKKLQNSKNFTKIEDDKSFKKSQYSDLNKDTDSKTIDTLGSDYYSTLPSSIEKDSSKRSLDVDKSITCNRKNSNIERKLSLREVVKSPTRSLANSSFSKSFGFGKDSTSNWHTINLFEDKTITKKLESKKPIVKITSNPSKSSSISEKSTKRMYSCGSSIPDFISDYDSQVQDRSASKVSVPFQFSEEIDSPDSIRKSKSVSDTLGFKNDLPSSPEDSICLHSTVKRTSGGLYNRKLEKFDSRKNRPHSVNNVIRSNVERVNSNEKSPKNRNRSVEHLSQKLSKDDAYDNMSILNLPIPKTKSISAISTKSISRSNHSLTLDSLSKESDKNKYFLTANAANIVQNQFYKKENKIDIQNTINSSNTVISVNWPIQDGKIGKNSSSKSKSDMGLGSSCSNSSHNCTDKSEPDSEEFELMNVNFKIKPEIKQKFKNVEKQKLESDQNLFKKAFKSSTLSRVLDVKTEKSKKEKEKLLDQGGKSTEPLKRKISITTKPFSSSTLETTEKRDPSQLSKDIFQRNKEYRKSLKGQTVKAKTIASRNLKSNRSIRSLDMSKFKEKLKRKNSVIKSKINVDSNCSSPNPASFTTSNPTSATCTPLLTSAGLTTPMPVSSTFVTPVSVIRRSTMRMINLESRPSMSQNSIASTVKIVKKNKTFPGQGTLERMSKKLQDFKKSKNKLNTHYSSATCSEYESSLSSRTASIGSDSDDETTYPLNITTQSMSKLSIDNTSVAEEFAETTTYDVISENLSDVESSIYSEKPIVVKRVVDEVVACSCNIDPKFCKICKIDVTGRGLSQKYLERIRENRLKEMNNNKKHCKNVSIGSTGSNGKMELTLNSSRNKAHFEMVKREIVAHNKEANYRRKKFNSIREAFNRQSTAYSIDDGY